MKKIKDTKKQKSVAINDIKKSTEDVEENNLLTLIEKETENSKSNKKMIVI